MATYQRFPLLYAGREGQLKASSMNSSANLTFSMGRYCRVEKEAESKDKYCQCHLSSTIAQLIIVYVSQTLSKAPSKNAIFSRGCVPYQGSGNETSARHTIAMCLYTTV